MPSLPVRREVRGGGIVPPELPEEGKFLEGRKTG